MMRIFVYGRHFSHSIRERRLVAFAADGCEDDAERNVAGGDNREELEVIFKELVDHGGRVDQLKEIIQERLHGDGEIILEEAEKIKDECKKAIEAVCDLSSFSVPEWNAIMDEFPLENDALLKFIMHEDRTILTPAELARASSIPDSSESSNGVRSSSNSRRLKPQVMKYDSVNKMFHYADGRPSETFAQYSERMNEKTRAAQGIDANTQFNSITGKPITAEDRKWAAAMRGPRGDLGRYYEKLDATAAKYGVNRKAPRYSAAQLPTYTVINGPNAPILKYQARQRTAKYMKDLDAKQNAEIAKRDADLQKNLPVGMTLKTLDWDKGIEIEEAGKVIGRYLSFTGKDGKKRGVIMTKGDDGIERMSSNIYPQGSLVSAMKKAVSPEHIHELSALGFSGSKEDTKSEIGILYACFCKNNVSPDDYMRPSVLNLAEKYSFANKVLGALKNTTNKQAIEKKIADISEKLTFCLQPAKEQVLQKLFKNRGWNTGNIARFLQDSKNPFNSLFS